ncbi:MAG: hypothetical protein LVQ96_08300 [Thermoplasmatales archaeon]|nr:hypothetical protein [Thermoplasmatales archaeon]
MGRKNKGFKRIALYVVIGMAIFAFSVSSSGMFGVNPASPVGQNAVANLIENGNGLTSVKVGQTNFIGEYIVSKWGHLSSPNLGSNNSNGVNQVSVSNQLIQIFGVKEYHKFGVRLSYSYGKIGNYTMQTLTYTANNTFFGLKMTDVLINLGPQHSDRRLSIMAIAFQPYLTEDLHLGDVLITDFSSNLYGQLVGIQSGITSLSVKYLVSGNETLATLGIYYLLIAQSLNSFIKITPDHILRQKVDITALYLVDGSLAACIAELASLGLAGVGLVSDAVACFTGIGFGIPCALFFLAVNALPIVEVIAINYAC